MKYNPHFITVGLILAIPLYIFLRFCIKGSLMNVTPSIQYLGNIIIVKSSWRAHLFSLGFGSRYVEINAIRKTIRIIRRKFWLMRSVRRFEFEWIDHITDSQLRLQTAFFEYQEYQVFTAAIVLKNEESVVLARFCGQGEFVDKFKMPRIFNWVDYWWAEHTQGNQQLECEEFTKKVRQLTGIPVRIVGT